MFLHASGLKRTGVQRHIEKDNDTKFCEILNKRFYSVAVDKSTAQIDTIML
jgi:hypothetical protein